MNCPYCGAPLSAGADFCTTCGKRIPLSFCTKCGAQLARGARFCPSCGAVLDAEEEPDAVQQTQQQDDEEVRDDSAWREGGSGRRWWPLIALIVIAAILTFILIAWGFGLFDRFGNGEGTSAAVEETEQADPDALAVHQLTITTKTLEFQDSGLTSRIYYSTDIEDHAQIIWSSSDASVATVDENGYVTAVSEGRTVITAQWESLSDTCTVICDFSRDTVPVEEPEEEDEPDAEEPEEETEPAAAATSGDYLCSFSSERLITEADMSTLSAGDYGALPAGKSLAQMIINEIYAKHGYQFTTAEIQRYFDQKSWYQEVGFYSSDQSVIQERMSDIEKQNVDFLKNYDSAH